MYNVIPEEHTFLYKDAIQDDKYFNRLWFKIPPTWETSLKNDPIIGIRNMFVPKTYRVLEFVCSLEMYVIKGEEVEVNPVNTLEFNVKSWLDNKEDLRKLYKDLKSYLNDAIEKNHKEHPDLPAFESSNIKMDFEFGKDDNNIPCYIERIFPESQNPKNYEIRLGLSDFNDDFRYVLNIANKNDKGEYIINEFPITDEIIRFYHVWDRHSCNVLASFAQENMQIGYLNQKYNPIKYYYLRNEGNKIWFEFYNNSENDIPIQFPKDGRDGLNIECVFLYNPPNNLILYK